MRCLKSMAQQGGEQRKSGERGCGGEGDKKKLGGRERMRGSKKCRCLWGGDRKRVRRNGEWGSQRSKQISELLSLCPYHVSGTFVKTKTQQVKKQIERMLMVSTRRFTVLDSRFLSWICLETLERCGEWALSAMGLGVISDPTLFELGDFQQVT